MYYQGLNVPQDIQEGVRWYHLAAAAGSLEAIRDLERLGLPLSN
jgi:TPR repeat protein